MNTLVTGGGGFLGRYIVEQLLARGDSVRVLCRGSYPALHALAVETIRASLSDRDAAVEACRGVDVVYHVASLAGIWGPWEHFHSVNVLGTENIVEGCRRHGVGRLIYTSSPSVTFDGLAPNGGAQKGVDESIPYPHRWLCHYPHTKALAEQHVLAANGSDGLST
ncbi:MAG: NAD-dependent epimerase/dehydratase family protein, partial [Planctomycetota bacterium]|nr:NAD-dependent epimerase/dehydratase family protein [Planctomycetota bacterium]